MYTLLKILKIPLLIIKYLLAIIIFILDHIAGLFAGAVLGLGKGLSGLFGMGLRSFGVSLLKKT